MSLGVSNTYLGKWPVFPGLAGLGSCLCGAGAGNIFYDVVAIGGGHGGDDASLARDFALPPRALFLVGEFTRMLDRRWNDDTGSPAWVGTSVATKRIAKIWARDTGQGCRHPQVDASYALSAGFTTAPVAIRRNWQDVGTGGNPPCELFVYGFGVMNTAPNVLEWEVAARTIGGTPYGAESVLSPAHKLGVGGVNWQEEDDFQAGWTSFRYPGYGTPGLAHAGTTFCASFAAGKRGVDRELWFQDSFGSATGPYVAGEVNLYGPSGALAFTQAAAAEVYSVRPIPQADFWMVGGTNDAILAGGNKEALVIQSQAGALVPLWGTLTGWVGGNAGASDVWVNPPASNAGGSYVAGDVVALRVLEADSGAGQFDWDFSGPAPQYRGGISLRKHGGGPPTDYDSLVNYPQAFHLEHVQSGQERVCDCDADGRIYFVGNFSALGGVACNPWQLYRVEHRGGNPTQIGSFGKAGGAGFVFGCVVLADPMYGGSGIAHLLVLGDFDSYTPPGTAQDTTPVSGLNGLAVIAIRDGQSVAQQAFWGGRFAAGATTVSTGDFLPGIVW